MHLIERGDMQTESSFWQLTNDRYCHRCRAEVSRELATDAMNHHRGWCENCRDLVGVTRCRVSYMFVTAVLTFACANICVNIFA
jgi:hypothetical protein